jgi:hypothetical protein
MNVSYWNERDQCNIDTITTCLITNKGYINILVAFQ